MPTSIPPVTYFAEGDGSRYQFEENVDSHSNSANPVAGCNIPDDPEIGAGIANVGDKKEYGV